MTLNYIYSIFTIHNNFVFSKKKKKHFFEEKEVHVIDLPYTILNMKKGLKD